MPRPPAPCSRAAGSGMTPISSSATRVPDGTSRQVWRSVADDKAACSVAARVEVARDAQKTDGEQIAQGPAARPLGDDQRQARARNLRRRRQMRARRHRRRARPQRALLSRKPRRHAGRGQGACSPAPSSPTRSTGSARRRCARPSTPTRKGGSPDGRRRRPPARSTGSPTSRRSPRAGPISTAPRPRRSRRR